MKETGLSFTTVLLIIFIVLKLVGSIAWSWWWVLSPLWIPAALWVVMLMILLSAKMIVKILTRNDNKWDAYPRDDYPREYHQWTSVRERREGKWGKYSTPKKEQ